MGDLQREEEEEKVKKETKMTEKITVGLRCPTEIFGQIWTFISLWMKNRHVLWKYGDKICSEERTLKREPDHLVV